MFSHQAQGRLVELWDEERYRRGASENAVRYDVEHGDADGEWQSAVGVQCGERKAVLLSCGLRGRVDQHSFVRVQDAIFVVCGSTVFGLSTPTLALKWLTEVDEASCLGVYLGGDGAFLISRGEIEIKRLTLEGHVVWSTAGRDIFTGAFEIRGDRAHAEDFHGNAYDVDLATGKATIVD